MSAASAIQGLTASRFKAGVTVLAIWTGVAGVSALQVYAGLSASGRSPSFLWLFIIHLVPWYLWAALTPLVYWLGRRLPLDRERWLRSAAWHLPVSALTALGVLLAQLAFNAMLEGIPLWSERALQGLFASVAMSLHEQILIYWLVLAAVTAYTYHARYQESRERFFDLVSRAAALEAEFESIRAGQDGDAQEKSDDNGGRHPARLVIRSTGNTAYLPTADIDWIKAADYYAEIHAHGRLYLLRESLDSLEKKLDPGRFVRIHRSTIVNLERVREMRPYRRGDYEVVLLDGSAFRLSRSRRSQVEDALTGVR